MGQIDDLVQQLSKESVAVFVLSFWHGNTFIVVQFLVAHFSCHHVELFHISISVHELFELFIEHLQTVDVDKILDVFETQLEIFKFLAQTDNFGEEFFRSIGLHS